MYAVREKDATCRASAMMRTIQRILVGEKVAGSLHNRIVVDSGHFSQWGGLYCISHSFSPRRICAAAAVAGFVLASI